VFGKANRLCLPGTKFSFPTLFSLESHYEGSTDDKSRQQSSCSLQLQGIIHNIPMPKPTRTRTNFADASAQSQSLPTHPHPTCTDTPSEGHNRIVTTNNNYYLLLHCLLASMMQPSVYACSSKLKKSALQKNSLSFARTATDVFFLNFLIFITSSIEYRSVSQFCGSGYFVK